MDIGYTTFLRCRCVKQSRCLIDNNKPGRFLALFASKCGVGPGESVGIYFRSTLTFGGESGVYYCVSSLDICSRVVVVVVGYQLVRIEGAVG